jgi:Flp pilus assembly protein TadD
MRVANIAHFAGAILGALIGAAVVAPKPRRAALSLLTAVLVLGAFVGATFARPFINLSRDASDERRLAYDALMADRNAEAYRWLTDAIRIEPQNPDTWHNYAIACANLGKQDEAIKAMARAEQLKGGEQPQESSSDSSGDGWMKKLRGR